MLSSMLTHVTLGLALSSAVSAAPQTLVRLGKRDPSANVLRGANFPDPSIITVDGVSYSVATVNGQYQLPMTQNDDFNNVGGWSDPFEIFPSDGVPAFQDGFGWAKPNTIWAPDINHLTDFDGSYAIYYSPEVKWHDGLHCVGLARSLSIQGPYNDSSSEPWVCPEADGGAIDAAGFLDVDNTRYVMYKIDGVFITGGGCSQPQNGYSNTSIMLQQTEADGYTKVGDPIQIWNNQGADDSYQTEAPQIVRGDDGTYFMFYSAGCYANSGYTTKYVTSTNGVRGPYGNPQVLMRNGDFGLFGPGGLDITPEGGQAVFHSLINNDINQGRYLNTVSVTLSGQTATLN